MPALRWLLALALCLGSAPAFGQGDALPPIPAPREVDLQYTVSPGAEGCPDEEFFKVMVRSDVGFDPFVSGAHARLTVTIAPSGRGLVHGYAELRDHLGKIHLLRYADPEECRYLASVLVVAIGIRMRASKPRVPVAEPTDEPTPSLSTYSEPVSVPTEQLPPVPEPTTPRPKGAALRVRISAPSTSFRLGVEAGVSAIFWVRPLQVAGQVVLGGVLRWRGVSLSLSGQFEPPVISGAREGVELSTSRLTGSAAPCLHIRWFYGCPVGELGAIFVSSILPGRPLIAWSALAGAQVGVELVPRDYVVVRLFGRGAGAVVRMRIPVRDQPPLWIAPAGSISLGATVVTFF